MADAATADLVRRLQKFDTCTICDAGEVVGHDGLVVGVQPLWQGARVCGPVITVQLAQVDPVSPPAAKVHLGVRAIEASTPGDVIVVANDARTEMGGWGGLLSRAAAGRGVAGAVVDGACRDVDEARETGFPVFARAGTARTARGRVHEVATGVPVQFAGVTVRTGDVVVADASGVVFVTPEVLPRLVAEAERIHAREQDMLERLGRDPDRVAAVLGADYEDMLRH